MTGLSPLGLGLQHGQIFPEEPWGLPNRFRVLPTFLPKEYASHLVGKWHLGHYSAEQLPTARGFDSFFGPVDGAQYYSTHLDAMKCRLPRELLESGLWNSTRLRAVVRGSGCYFDMRDGTRRVEDLLGTYSTSLYADKAKGIIATHDSHNPLFLIVSFNAVHAPVWAPTDFSETHPGVLEGIKNADRRKFAAALRLVDDAIEEVVGALQASGLYENTVVAFASDNGANPEHGGSNSPLRGSKGYLFEGGVRVPAFLRAPAFLPRGTRYEGLFHVTDWLPTLVEGVAGGSWDHGEEPTPYDRSFPLEQRRRRRRRESTAAAAAADRRAAAALEAYFESVNATLEGMNLWFDLAAAAADETAEFPRTEVLLNINYLDASLEYTSEPLGYDTAAIIARGWKCVVNSGDLGWYATPEAPDAKVSLDTLGSTQIRVAEPHTYLFYLPEDPEERDNLAATYPEVLDVLAYRLLEYRTQMRPCEWRPEDPDASVQFRTDDFVGPWWNGDEPPPLSPNCLDGFGDHAVARFRPPGRRSLDRNNNTASRRRRRDRYGYDW
ncbi:hypothetical protein CTAYLR_010119 [Chrysophaeum taylorii]|uniref:Sulfatase N-terminal domain-containing protein n=1 Tax=Chrysophaeum taylorii TaxID=2483200 RepID=A0AAD7XR17_9STRA|nr:hypothetical protein CTAYLR_010119 [Chrysophaeum taylorii]